MSTASVKGVGSNSRTAGRLGREHGKEEAAVEQTGPFGARRSDVWRSRTDRELIVAMRTGTSAAFDEFIARYEPLLRSRTSRSSLPSWERDDCVADTLQSVILHLLRPDVRAPATMAAYLTRALHNRLADASRARCLRNAVEDSEADQVDPAMDHAAMSTMSRYSVEACAPADEARVSLPCGLEHLAAALVRPLTDEERLLISWEGNMIPHRTVAEWLGISRAAATKRIWRLRTRLREAAAAYARSLPPPEQVEVERYFHARPGKRESSETAVVAEHAGSTGDAGYRARRATAMEERHDA